ncbi:hypothetical protein C9439_04940 [archaeon SCG-AAA382B04]|nr:hypothetical protein C9439_04940 [archaeon SCG-AAA382B04]
MKIYPKCVPCLLQRAYYEVQMSNIDGEKEYEAMSRALEELSNKFTDKNATFEVSTEMHRAVYEVIDTDDPYKEKKKLGNEVIKELSPKIKAELKNDENSFKKAMVASIVANSLDFGVLEHEIDPEELGEDFPEKVKDSELGIDDTEKIKEEIKDADEIAFVADNCGEIIIDKLFLEEIETLSDANIVLYVRGAPIFNDVTLEEAKEVGITNLVDEVIELGGRAVGVNPKYVPEKVREKLFSSDLIISKGMANYESLSEFEGDLNVSYVFKVKCEPVADSVGAQVGENVAIKR